MPKSVAAPFRLIPPTGDPRGVVLLMHGMTGTSDDMKELGDALHSQNYVCLLPLLSGHGTTISEFKRTPTRAWLNDARAGFQEAQTFNKPIHLVGLSFGAVLALYLACTYKEKITSITLLSPALSIQTWTKTFLLRTLSYLPDMFLNNLPIIPKRKNQNHTVYVSQARYNVYSIGAAIRLFKIVRYVARRIHRLRIPGLVCFDHNDALVNVRVVMHFLKKKLPPKLFKFREYRNAGHEMLYSRQTKAIINDIVMFITRFESR